ncbi:MAG: prepilin-type N-terminal cleavage/methylation domain-containing protein [Deltaproteobacteria bacterium]|nr:prepilin-type N-terminal cleavage/methylation domain-containing protein [Deltaproteobacteria bacterium]
MAGKCTKRSRGFTLIELMIVVAIIGVLASVAIPSFINYQLSSKRTEAYANLSALAKAQKSYFAEYNTFVPALSEPGFTLGSVAPTTTTRSKVPLETAFAAVGWVPDGDVFFDYDTATPGNSGSGTCTCVDACFTAAAYGDLDGDGSISALVFAHPDALGQYCESTMVGFAPPLNTAGSRMLDEVARIPMGIADDF